MSRASFSKLSCRGDILTFLFTEAYWNDLTPETALLARLYATYCKEVKVRSQPTSKGSPKSLLILTHDGGFWFKDELRLEACLPVITSLAFKIQDRLTSLQNLAQQVAALPAIDEDEEEDEETLEVRSSLVSAIFTMDQLLQVALLEDYGDEIGRRKMFTLIRK